MTVRDSSLSACTQAVLAAEVGHLDLAYDYLAEAALMDLDDLEHNTRDGLHIASLAGTWIGAVAGFGGMRDHGGVLSFMPQLPQPLSRLAFRLTFRGRRLLVEIAAQSRRRYTLIEGERSRSCTTARQRRSFPEEPLTLAIPPPPRHGQRRHSRLGGAGQKAPTPADHRASR